MVAVLAILAQAIVGVSLAYDDGRLAGPNDYSGFKPGVLLKEVVRFDSLSPMRVSRIEMTLAGTPAPLKLHVWQDLDSTVRPHVLFHGFEFDLIRPIELQVKEADLGRPLKIDLAKLGRSFPLQRGQRVFVGIEVTPEGPRFGCDAANSRPQASVTEAYDAAAPGLERSRLFASAGDFLGRLSGSPIPEAQSPKFRDVRGPMGLPRIEAKSFAWSDVDGDGWEDLLVNGDRLFRNEKGVRFREISARAGVQGEPRAFGLCADVDNDGDADLFQAAMGRQGVDRFLVNDGKGRLKSAPGSPLRETGYACAGSWLDANGDGKLDLFVANGTKRGDSGPADHDALYINRGAGRFVDAAGDFGLVVESFSTSSVAADLDENGKPELFVGTYRLEPDQLWSFSAGQAKDLAYSAGLRGGPTPSGKPGMGHALGANMADLDNDGDLDLIVANLIHPDWRGLEASNESWLFKNLGGLRFRRTPLRAMGISFEETISDPAIADFDNDGWLDLFHNSWYHSGSLYVRRGRRFEDRTASSGVRTRHATASAACDFDRDGRMDLVVADEKAGLRLYRNVSPKRPWIQIVLQGTHCSRDAVGAVVRLDTGSASPAQSVFGGRGMGCQDSQVLHFGLGALRSRPSVRIQWPCGRVQRQQRLSLSKRTTVRERR